MRTRLLIVPALLAAAAGVAHTQPPPSGYTPPAVVPNAPPADKSVDQLLDRLEALRTQKAELERQEQELVKEIRRKVEKQVDRMQRLGVGPDGGFQPAPMIPSPNVSYAPSVLPATPARIPAPPAPLPAGAPR